MEQPIVGGYKVTWRNGYMGDRNRVYVGICDADSIRAGKYTLADAIRRILGETLRVDPSTVCLLEVKAGNKVIHTEVYRRK